MDLRRLRAARAARIAFATALTLCATAASASADVTIDKQGPASVNQGANIAYTVTVANTDPTEATDVEVTDTLPAGTTFVSATAPCVHLLGTVTCEFASLPATSSTVLNITVTADDAGTATNNVSLQSTPAPTIGSDSVATTVNDVTAPVVTVTSPSDGSTIGDATPTFSGVAGTADGDAAQVTVEVFAGGDASGPILRTLVATPGGGGAYTTASVTPALASGTYTARVTQVDGSGNSGTDTTTFTVDATAPSVVLAAPANGSTTADTTPEFSGTAGTDAGDETDVTVQVWSGPNTSGTLVATLTANRGLGSSYAVSPSTPLASGVYTARASQSDALNNTGLSNSTTFTVDAIAPAVSLTTPVNGTATNDATPLFSGGAGNLASDAQQVTVEVFEGTAIEGGETPLATIDTSRAGGASWGVSPVTPLADGTYTARARQVDTVNNVGLSGPRTFTIDTTAPVLTLTAPVEGLATNDTTPDVSGLAGTAARDAGQVTVEVYNGTIENGEVPIEDFLVATGAGGEYAASLPNDLADGVYAIRARQGDSAGNSGVSPAHSITIDTVAPQSTIVLGPDGRADAGAVNRSGRPAFEFMATDSNGLPTLGATFTCRIDDGIAAPCVSGQPLIAPESPPLADGPHTVTIAAADPATNVDTSPATRAFSVDSAAPRPVITGPTSGSVVTTSRPTFTGTAGTATGDQETVTLEVFSGPSTIGARFPDIQATRNAAGTWTVQAPQDIRDDLITVRAKQRDQAPGDGLSDPVTFVIDTKAPETTLDSGPAGTIATTTAAFGFSSDDPSSTFECRFDAGGFGPCASGQVFGGLAAGAHTFEVRAVDAVGNRDATPASRGFTVSLPAGPPPPAGPFTVRFPSKLELQRSTVARRRLDVLAPITRRASGTARIGFEAGGRTTRFTQKVDATRGRLSFVRALSRQQSRQGTGILTIDYPGDEDTRAQEVRLRAGPNGSALRTTSRPRIAGGRLRTSGTIARRARGVVRFSMDWNAADGTTRTFERTARVANGRWTLNAPLSAVARESIANRLGTVHSYTLFTGYLPRRMRGEMLSYEVLPFRG